MNFTVNVGRTSAYELQGYSSTHNSQVLYFQFHNFHNFFIDILYLMFISSFIILLSFSTVNILKMITMKALSVKSDVWLLSHFLSFTFFFFWGMDCTCFPSHVFYFVLQTGNFRYYIVANICDDLHPPCFWDLLLLFSYFQ